MRSRSMAIAAARTTSSSVMDPQLDLIQGTFTLDDRGDRPLGFVLVSHDRETMASALRCRPIGAPDHLFVFADGQAIEELSEQAVASATGHP